jgi:hypothetical protein
MNKTSREGNGTPSPPVSVLATARCSEAPALEIYPLRVVGPVTQEDPRKTRTAHK